MVSPGGQVITDADEGNHLGNIQEAKLVGSGTLQDMWYERDATNFLVVILGRQWYHQMRQNIKKGRNRSSVSDMLL